MTELTGELAMSDHTLTTTAVDRRRFIALSGTTVAALATAGLFSGKAIASPEETTARIKELTGGKNMQEGRISIKLPHVAENGNTVPVTVSVDSPMTEDDHVTSVHLFAEKNPAPEIASFHLTPMSGEAKIATRVRLAKTQNVIAVAQMSDGSIYTGKKQIKVTIGGCGG
jgi:sulfur-oxidizing protein SoxY